MSTGPNKILFDTNVDCPCAISDWSSSIACVNHLHLAPGTYVVKPTNKTLLLSPRQDFLHNLIVYHFDPALCAYKVDQVHKLLQSALGQFLTGSNIRQKYRLAIERLCKEYGHTRSVAAVDNNDISLYGAVHDVLLPQPNTNYNWSEGNTLFYPHTESAVNNQAISSYEAMENVLVPASQTNQNWPDNLALLYPHTEFGIGNNVNPIYDNVGNAVILPPSRAYNRPENTALLSSYTEIAPNDNNFPVDDAQMVVRGTSLPIHGTRDSALTSPPNATYNPPEDNALLYPYTDQILQTTGFAPQGQPPYTYVGQMLQTVGFAPQDHQLVLPENPLAVEVSDTDRTEDNIDPQNYPWHGNASPGERGLQTLTILTPRLPI